MPMLIFKSSLLEQYIVQDFFFISKYMGSELDTQNEGETRTDATPLSSLTTITRASIQVGVIR